MRRAEPEAQAAAGGCLQVEALERALGIEQPGGAAQFTVLVNDRRRRTPEAAPRLAGLLLLYVVLQLLTGRLSPPMRLAVVTYLVMVCWLLVTFSSDRRKAAIPGVLPATATVGADAAGLVVQRQRGLPEHLRWADVLSVGYWREVPWEPPRYLVLRWRTAWRVGMLFAAPGPPDSPHLRLFETARMVVDAKGRGLRLPRLEDDRAVPPGALSAAEEVPAVLDRGLSPAADDNAESPLNA